LSMARVGNKPGPLNPTADTSVSEAGAAGHVPRSVERVAAGPTHDEIASRAHQLFKECAREASHESEHWFRAEREL
jgi:hypothetical protein